MATFAFASAPTTLTLTEAPRVVATPGTIPKGKLVRLTGSVQFSVHNLDQRLAQGCRMSIKPVPPAQANWFNFKDELPTSPGRLDNVEFEKDATQTVTVLLAIPADAPGGQYMFTVQAAADRDTDNDVTQSPSVAFTVPEPKPIPLPPKFPLWGVAAAVVMVLLAGGTAAYVFWPENKVAIPELANRDRDSAITELVKLGLKPTSTTVHWPLPADKVIDTDPKATTLVGRDTVVTVRVSDGKVVVPKLRNINVVNAVEALKAVKLEAKAAATEPSAQEVGTIVRSTPNEDSVAEIGKTVQLVIASPQGVPNPCHANDSRERIGIFCNLQVLTTVRPEILRQQVEILKVPVR